MARLSRVPLRIEGEDRERTLTSSPMRGSKQPARCWRLCPRCCPCQRPYRSLSSAVVGDTVLMSSVIDLNEAMASSSGTSVSHVVQASLPV
ncbi:hypothetical protein BD311DRAFT_758146 [Dichomitus squalens]|uniref:Uncharacterized protein n=1 Tax=Dichomitus squalens TaxID=114155 RepID=A0A4V2K0F0_9APHY|nr:hypothetical protein BD311DRAFT_758146 [Dichomitus squalens]